MRPQDLFPELKAWRNVRLTDHLDLFKKDKPCDWQNELENLYDANIYGGYMETRSPLFDSRHDLSLSIHLGIDYWVKEETPIKFPIHTGFGEKGIVVYSGTSDNCRGGWGGRVDIYHDGKVIIFGHLSNESVEYYKNTYVKYIRYGAILGYVGSRAENGGWRPHLHVQVMDSWFYSSFANPRNIDAYGSDEAEFLSNFYDPESI